MRKGWEYKSFETCINKLSKPKQVKTSEYSSGTKYPIISQEDKLISGYYDDESYVFHIDSPVVIFGDHTRVLKYVDFDFVVGADGVKIISPKRELNAKFLLYYLQWYKIPNLGYSRHYKLLKEIDIPLPPLSTQIAIVSELDKINELIRLKKEQLKDFDNLAQSLFYEMFGEGKCMRKKLKDIVKIQSGQVSPLEEPYSEMIHVGPANIESNTGRLLNLKTAKEENLISGKYLFNSSMVLYSKIRPNLNKVTIPSFEGICSADMYPIIPLECIDKNFLLFLLKQKEFLTYAISNSGRANIPKINREALLNYEAILPPLSLQRLFAQRIEQIEREKSEVQKSIQDLETLLASRMQYWFK